MLNLGEKLCTPLLFSALMILFAEVVKVHLASVINSVNQIGYLLDVTSNRLGLEFKVKGLSEEKVIKAIITSLAFSKCGSSKQSEVYILSS